MKIKGINVCIGCMHPLDKDGECPHCHLNIKEYKPIPHCLLPGTTLAKRYMLGKVLGEGNFGITYVAWDFVLEVPVAIKEFFPADLVNRDIIRGTDKDVYAQGNEAEYQKRLDKFIQEARYLTRFSSREGIVSVRDFFYANKTAYIVMEYVAGESVKKLVQTKGRINAGEVLHLMQPVLMSLAKVHRTGLLHRDISPDNLLFNEDGKLVLIDFGAARVCDFMAMKSMTVLFKRGFSPEEQYRAHGSQGEWSDIYSVCATMYYMLTGKIPTDAIERMAGEPLPSLVDMEEIELPLKTKEAIMKGLSLKAEKRYQRTEQLIEDLYKESVTTERKDVPKQIKWIAATVVPILILFIVIAAQGNFSSEKPVHTDMASGSAIIRTTKAPAVTVKMLPTPKKEKRTKKPTPKPTPKRKATKKPTKTPKIRVTSKPTKKPKKTKKTTKKKSDTDDFIGSIG